MKMNRKKGYFSISAVAKMFSIHQQTIRLYEKEGLIVPRRSDGNTRLFSEEDINRLEEIIYLTHELGINLAGVEMIFKLKKQINKMQKDMNKVFDSAQEELDKETELSKQAIKTSAQRLMKIKNNEIKKTDSSDNEPTAFSASVSEAKPDTVGFETTDIDAWEIDYDE